jgi:ABC-type tungstate transport system substrate-binding protein
MNITLVGEDSEGMVYTISIFKEFISPTIGNWIIAIAIGIVLISLSFKLASYMKNKRKEKQSVTDKKNGIKIDIDKEFL